MLNSKPHPTELPGSSSSFCSLLPRSLSSALLASCGSLAGRLSCAALLVVKASKRQSTWLLLELIQSLTKRTMEAGREEGCCFLAAARRHGRIVLRNGRFKKPTFHYCVASNGGFSFAGMIVLCCWGKLLVCWLAGCDNYRWVKMGHTLDSKDTCFNLPMILQHVYLYRSERASVFDMDCLCGFRSDEM